MSRVGFALVVFFLAGIASLRADQITAAVQQALKDQGFYYGQVTGVRDEDTTAAIRRYQIRNGLQITGEVDAETLRSLRVSPDSVGPAPQPRSTPLPEEPRPNEGPPQPSEIPVPDNRAPVGPAPGYAPAPPSPQFAPGYVFAGTPYEMAPPDLQRHVIVGAQTLLLRFGFYRSGVDGVYGPGTAEALRIFQARSGLVADGRLNMATLAALGLLPGQHRPGFSPARPAYRGRPVYRGVWIPDR